MTFALGCEGDIGSCDSQQGDSDVPEAPILEVQSLYLTHRLTGPSQLGAPSQLGGTSQLGFWTSIM